MDEAKPLDDRHDEVYAGAHVVCREAAHEGVEFRGRGADAHQKGDLDEDDEEGACAVIRASAQLSTLGTWLVGGGGRD